MRLGSGVKIEMFGQSMIRIDRAVHLQNGPWSICTVRKPFKCALSETEYPKGTRAFKPLGNGSLRYQRIAAQAVLEIEQVKDA